MDCIGDGQTRPCEHESVKSLRCISYFSSWNRCSWFFHHDRMEHTLNHVIVPADVVQSSELVLAAVKLSLHL